MFRQRSVARSQRDTSTRQMEVRWLRNNVTGGMTGKIFYAQSLASRGSTPEISPNASKSVTATTSQKRCNRSMECLSRLRRTQDEKAVEVRSTPCGSQESSRLWRMSSQLTCLVPDTCPKGVRRVGTSFVMAEQVPEPRDFL